MDHNGNRQSGNPIQEITPDIKSTQLEATRNHPSRYIQSNTIIIPAFRIKEMMKIIKLSKCKLTIQDIYHYLLILQIFVSPKIGIQLR